MRTFLLSIMATLLLLPGCSSKSEKIPEQIFGKWFLETPDSKDESPEARAVGFSYEFKADGTCIHSFGPVQETQRFRIKEGKITIGDNPPETLHEVKADRLVIGDGPNQRVFKR